MNFDEHVILNAMTYKAKLNCFGKTLVALRYLFGLYVSFLRFFFFCCPSNLGFYQNLAAIFYLLDMELQSIIYFQICSTYNQLKQSYAFSFS